MAAPHGQVPPGKGRSWRRAALAGLAVLLLVALVLHQPLLRAAAGLLIVDQSHEPATHLLILGGDGRFERAARFVATTRGGLLVIEGYPDRLTEARILPSPEVLAHRALRERGVPEEAIEIIPARTRNAREGAEALARWLDRHPRARIGVLCARFGSRAARHSLDRDLPAALAGRVWIWPLADRRYDERDWWRTRTGAKEFVLFWIRLACATAGEGEPLPPPRWDADAYEERLRRLAEVDR